VRRLFWPLSGSQRDRSHPPRPLDPGNERRWFVACDESENPYSDSFTAERTEKTGSAGDLSDVLPQRAQRTAENNVFENLKILSALHHNLRQLRKFFGAKFSDITRAKPAKGAKLRNLFLVFFAHFAFFARKFLLRVLRALRGESCLKNFGCGSAALASPW
jgi:hypothetical protein